MTDARVSPYGTAGGVPAGPGRWRGVRAPLAVAAAGASAVLALRVRDPHVSGSWGYCPFTYVTGIPCPGCGGLRAWNDLTHLDVVGALSSNALAVALGVGLVVAWAVWFVRRWRGRDVPMLTLGVRGVVSIAVLFVVFGLFRLTPWGSWLAP